MRGRNNYSCHFLYYVELQLDTVMDINYSFNCDKDGRRLNDWGLQIIPSRVTDGILFVAVCLVGNFELPPYYELVSPVYYFWSKEKISESLTFDMQHSVEAKTVKQASCLSFVSADTACGPPFRFSLVKGGKFNPMCTRGVISTKPQGLLAIVKKKLGRLTLRTEPQVRYDAQVFYTWDTPMDYECTAHIVVTPSTKAWQKVMAYIETTVIVKYSRITCISCTGTFLSQIYLFTCIPTEVSHDVSRPYIDLA